MTEIRRNYGGYREQLEKFHGEESKKTGGQAEDDRGET